MEEEEPVPTHQELPFEAVVSVLQRVDLGHRLTSCALVCSSWATAAVKATWAVNLDNQAISTQRLQDLQRWLRKARAEVNTLCLHNDAAAEPFVLTVPELVGALHNPGGLVQLSISNATCLAGSLSSLGGCSALQQLSLRSVQAPAGLSPLLFPGFLLRDLPHLTSLQLGPGLVVWSLALQHLSCLRDLQQLHLAWPGRGFTPQPLQHLTALSHLTSLSLAGVGFGFSREETPELLQLTGLQHLALTACSGGFEAAALTALTRLRAFELSDTRVQGGDAGVSTLLSCLPRLPHLTSLALTYCLVSCGVEAAAYSALTAASQLQHLTLHDQVLPKEAWQEVFPANRQLLGLRAVSIAAGGPGQRPLQQADLDRLAQCCPHLQELAVGRALHPSVSLTPLTRLSGLLRLSAPHMMCEALSCLTGLTELEVCAPSNVRAQDLLCLRPLRQLQRLVLQPHCADWSLGLGSSRLEFVNKAAEGMSTDVLQQLVAACAARGVELPGLSAQERRAAEQQQVAEPQVASPCGSCDGSDSGAASAGCRRCSLQ